MVKKSLGGRSPPLAPRGGAPAQGWVNFLYEGPHLKNFEAEGSTDWKSKKMSCFLLKISEENKKGSDLW